MKKNLPGQDLKWGPFRQQADVLPTDLQKPSYIGRWKILIYSRRPRTSIFTSSSSIGDSEAGCCLPLHQNSWRFFSSAVVVYCTQRFRRKVKEVNTVGLRTHGPGQNYPIVWGESVSGSRWVQQWDLKSEQTNYHSPGQKFFYLSLGTDSSESANASLQLGPSICFSTARSILRNFDIKKMLKPLAHEKTFVLCSFNKVLTLFWQLVEMAQLFNH